MMGYYELFIFWYSTIFLIIRQVKIFYPQFTKQCDIMAITKTEGPDDLG